MLCTGPCGGAVSKVASLLLVAAIEIARSPIAFPSCLQKLLWADQRMAGRRWSRHAVLLMPRVVRAVAAAGDRGFRIPASVVLQQKNMGRPYPSMRSGAYKSQSGHVAEATRKLAPLYRFPEDMGHFVEETAYGTG
jgi:hypothetical protein